MKQAGADRQKNGGMRDVPARAVEKASEIRP